MAQKAYKVRSDYRGSQYWSKVFNWTDEAITINEGMAKIHVALATTNLGIKEQIYLIPNNRRLRERMDKEETIRRLHE